MNSITDFRRQQRAQALIDKALREQFGAFQQAVTQQMMAMTADLAALVKTQGQLISKQQLIIDDLAKTMKPTLLGDTSITIPAVVLGVTLQATQRAVKPLAGIRPGDFLQPIMSEYLPDGWSLPQLVCRNAGQVEIRIAIPSGLAVGTPARTVTFGVMALRAVPLT